MKSHILICGPGSECVGNAFMLMILEESQQWPLSHFPPRGLCSRVFLSHGVDKLILQILAENKSRWTSIHSGP